MYRYNNTNIDKAYEQAKEVYAGFGVNTDEALKSMDKVHVSLHCWQGDDVSGFETGADGITGGGILATGNYPGRARSGKELRQDLEKVLSLIPGKHKVNLHAIYAETGGEAVERDQLEPKHFSGWIKWAKENGLGLDFNPTCFSHPKATSGYTLSSSDPEIRNFWIRHVKKSREIAAYIGKELGKTCINNIWIPDGSKDMPANRLEHREILRDSLDEIFKDAYDEKYLLDAVESKLFGIGSESYVVGSHEFYMGYAVSRNKMLCLDAGHFHPTETISDKISSLLTYQNRLLLHVSRGVRWDSDHVVILNDELRAIAQEIKRCGALEKVYPALDYFDASINRITAWVTGARAFLFSMLSALLEPTEMLEQKEKEGDLGARLALHEEFRQLPAGAVWNKYCLEKGVAAGAEWINSVSAYEQEVLTKRI